MPEAKLLVVGDGPMRHDWQELVNRNDLGKHVLFLGHVSEQIKLDLLSKCSALVFPSIEEGFGLVIIEALAMSKPVLTSNVRPFDEIVDDNVDGFLLPPNDPTAWSDKILYILRDPQVREEMGRRGRNEVIRRFNLEVASNKMEQLYKTVISKREPA